MDYNQRKVNHQVNRPAGKKASPARLAAIAEARKVARVRVEPTSEQYRVLRHPNGMAFRSEGSIEWPNDRFTQRRIAEGSIRIVESAEGRQERQQEAEAAPSRRGQSSRASE